MNVLVIGSGGREHALCWGISRGASVRTLRCAPGNAGIASVAERVPLAADAIDALVEHARRERYDLVVIGPEAPLVAGLADRLRECGITTFGPSAAAARLEGSKVFAKEFMSRHDIPTAAFRVFDDGAALVSYVRDPSTSYPLVLKADGLAAGKGVLIVDDREGAEVAARRLIIDREFGQAGDRVVAEECLRGREVSFFVLTDGTHAVDLTTCQDYKRALDHDRGPNTGGMGTYSPSAFIDDETRETILARIVRPTVRGLADEGMPYRGVLFVGLMLTEDGPKVLEYNCRFGDPETQVLVPRLDGDWADVLDRCARGDLEESSLRWSNRAAVCVVMASRGYPGTYPKGATIDGLDVIEREDACLVFHAGTDLDSGGRVVTAGGRVLGVTALGDDLGQARDRAYDAVRSIRWDGAQFRNDIALDAV